MPVPGQVPACQTSASSCFIMLSDAYQRMSDQAILVNQEVSAVSLTAQQPGSGRLEAHFAPWRAASQGCRWQIWRPGCHACTQQSRVTSWLVTQRHSFTSERRPLTEPTSDVCWLFRLPKGCAVLRLESPQSGKSYCLAAVCQPTWLPAFRSAKRLGKPDSKQTVPVHHSQP